MGGLNVFRLRHIFALDSVVVKHRIGGFVMYAMHHPTYYDETKKIVHGSYIVRTKEKLKLSHGGTSQGQALGTNSLMVWVRVLIKSEACPTAKETLKMSHGGGGGGRVAKERHQTPTH